MKKAKNLAEPFIPAIVTLIVFMGVLALKGIFPFGELRIDYYDMGQTNAPLYYHIWDFLHGRGGLFYSWYIDGGQNLSMGSSIQWNISVFNLFFLFIRRNQVMEMLSVFTGLRLFFMAFNMDLFLRRTIETPRFYRLLFSLAYGLTGFTLTHYTITTYLDTAALMPLYLITLHDVLTGEFSGTAGGEDFSIVRKKKLSVYIKSTTIYALMTGYMTALGYYMAFMNLIFVLLASGTYVLILAGAESEDADERRAVKGRAATRLGIGTIAGIGLSAFILLPAAMQMTHSSRFNSNLSGGLTDTLHDILWAIGADMYYIKWWLLSGSLAAIVILVTGLIRFRRERRQAVFFFLFCMYPCAMIVFESINLLWHMGTYYHYPIRCGYLIPLVLLTTAAYYSGRNEQEENILNYVNQRSKDTAVTGTATGSESYVNYDIRLMIVMGVLSVAAGAALIYYYTSHPVWKIEELFKAWIIFALMLVCVYFVLWSVIRQPACIAPVLIMELAVTAHVGYGQPHFTDRFSSDPEQSGEYVMTAQELQEELHIDESRTDRIKNPDTTLNTNYGFVMRRATVGGWANTVPRAQMDAAIALGYGAHFMRILDCGGTMLSDAMLRVTETLTLKPELYTVDAYEPEGEAHGYTLFSNKYTMPFVMKLSMDSAELAAESERIAGMDVADATNTLYGWLTSEKEAEGDDGKIMRDITDEISSGSYYVNYRQALYLRGGEFDELRINGKTIPVPDIGDPDGTAYPAWFNSSLLYLGVYDDEEIHMERAEDAGSVFYAFDMEKLERLCSIYENNGEAVNAGRSTLDFTVDAEDGQTALIPMAYDEGFRAAVNGERTSLINAGDLFIAVPLKEGRNEIRLSFTPRGLAPGIAISLITLALVVIFSIRPLDTGALDKVSAGILAVVWGAFVTVLYIIPYIAFLVHQIEKRILC